MTVEAAENKKDRTGQEDKEHGTAVAVPVTLVAVRFRNDRPSVHCNAGNLMPEIGEWVVVPCEQCNEVGQVAGLPARMELPGDCEIPAIERLATTREIELFYQNLENERNARRVCLDRIAALKLKMKLVRVESLFDGSKIIFYYSADGRVDFRELVKNLVSMLKTRVEMCQIGIRHEAKMTGGIGSCGRILCCTGFLKSFDPVSIKMAKVQNLPLNPNKISGFCGRLLCCLTFEYETYQEYARHLPSMGNMCDSPSGAGKVVRRNILKKTVSLSTEHNGVVEFTNEELEDFKERRERGLPSRSSHRRDRSSTVHSPSSGGEQGKKREVSKKDSTGRKSSRKKQETGHTSQGGSKKGRRSKRRGGAGRRRPKQNGRKSSGKVSHDTAAMKS